MSTSTGVSSISLGIPCLLAVLWAISVWPVGGEFRLGWYPGAIALLALAVVLFAFAPWRARLKSPASGALAALALLGAWSFFSMLWSPAPDRAFYDAELVFLYATVFLAGLWLAHLRGHQPSALFVPVVIAAASITVATTVVLAFGTDVGKYLLVDNTLKFPVGSRSANAAFFLIAFWPTLVLATRVGLNWRYRAPLLGAATLMLNLAILSQSRASVVAAVAGTIAYVAISPKRKRAIAHLGLAVVPVAVALPWLLDIVAEASTREITASLLHSAARAMALSAVAAAGLGATYALLEEKLKPSPAVVKWSGRAVAVAIALLVIAGSAAFVRAEGDPTHWLSARYQEFKTGGDSISVTSSTRFVVNASSNRYDAWRVAWQTARSEPLRGAGAGGFLFRHTLERRAGRPQQNPHNVSLLFLSELGLPGLLFFVAFIAAAITGAVRSRRHHRAACTLATAALVTAIYWIVQASIDPLWARPVITAPVAGLLGAACAPVMRETKTPLSRIHRVVPAGLAILLALAAIPAYLSDRYVRDAYAAWDSSHNLQQAIADLDRAQSLNPLADAPFIAKGIITRRAGNRGGALEAYREAVARKPDYWATHERIAREVQRRNPSMAMQEMETALELNPGSKRVRRDLILLYIREAYEIAPRSVERAYAYVDRAHELNRLFASPLVAKGFIARDAGDRGVALRAFRAALDRDPELWVPHYEIAMLIRRSNPVAAAEEMQTALQLRERNDQRQMTRKALRRLAKSLLRKGKNR